MTGGHTAKSNIGASTAMVSSNPSMISGHGEKCCPHTGTDSLKLNYTMYRQKIY